MRKKICFLVIFLVFFVSASVLAAKDEVYFWDFMDSADLDYAQNDGMIQYKVNLLDSDDDGLEHYFGFAYGVTNDIELKGNAALIQDSFQFTGTLKNKLYDAGNLGMAVQLAGSYASEPGYTYFSFNPSVQVLQKSFSGFQLHTNTYFQYYKHGYDNWGSFSGYNWVIDNGFTYQISPAHILKAALSSSWYKFDFDTFSTTLDAGYRWNISDHLAYNLYYNYLLVDLDYDSEVNPNMHLTNALTFVPATGFEVTGMFKYNSTSSNGIQLNVKKVLFENLTLKNSSWMWLSDDPSYIVQFAVQYDL